MHERAQRLIEPMTDEIVDAFLGQIGPPEMIREQHPEEPFHDAAQRLARGHLAIALVDAALTRARARRAQLADNRDEVPVPVGHGAVWVHEDFRHW